MYLRIGVNLAGRVHAANGGKKCTLLFVIIFVVPVLFMGMDCLLNVSLLIMFK